MPLLPSHDALDIVAMCGRGRGKEARPAIKREVGVDGRHCLERLQSPDSAPQDGRCRHMAQSRPASTESVPVDRMLMPWPKRPCPCSLLPAARSPRGLFNCHGRCKTRANHRRQRPLCITQPRQDRRAADATTSLRGLFLTLQALSLCRLGHGRREWPDGLNCRQLSSSRCQPARWLVSRCFLVFLAPSVSSPASSLRDAPMKPAGGGEHPVRPIHIHHFFLQGTIPTTCFVPRPRCRRASKLDIASRPDGRPEGTSARGPASTTRATGRSQRTMPVIPTHNAVALRVALSPARGGATQPAGVKAHHGPMSLATLRGSFVPSPEHLLKPASTGERCGSTHAWGRG